MENALAPDYRIFMDGRFGGLFAEFLPVLEEASASPERWRAFLDAQGIELAVIDRDRMPFARAPARSLAKPLDEYYMPRDRWALIYWDRRAVMWVRRSAVDPTWLAAREFRWLHPGGAADLRIAMKKGRVTARAVRQELKRYAYDIGDPGETTFWVGQLQKPAGAPRSAAGR